MINPNLWHFISGYVIIDLSGFRLEKVLSEFAFSGVYLKNTERVSYTVMRAELPAMYLRRAKAIAREYNVELKVEKYRGGSAPVMFFMNNKLLLSAIAFCVAAVCAMFMFVWHIDIQGAEDTGEYPVREYVRELGIHSGTAKSHLDLTELEKNIDKKFEEIRYVNAYFSGITLVIEVIEGIDPPQVFDEDVSNLVATENALIERVIVSDGEALVDVGDVVKSGDTLISGTYIIGETEFEAAARGEVIGRVWRNAECGVEYNSFKLEGTGEKTAVKYLSIGRFYFPIELPNVDYEHFIITDAKHTLLGENTVLPVHIISANAEKAIEITDELAKERAMAEAREKAYYKVLSVLPEDAEIQKMHVYYAEEKGRITADVRIETVENIAVREYIGG